MIMYLNCHGKIVLGFNVNFCVNYRGAHTLVRRADKIMKTVIHISKRKDKIRNLDRDIKNISTALFT
jgi:hypothetical protein